MDFFAESELAALEVPLDFVGVSSEFRILTFPLVNCSAFTTSAGKFVITLLLERYLSAVIE